MSVYEKPGLDIEFPVDALDRALIVAWFLSDLAFDIFGLLFWAAIALCLAMSLL
ncbi:MAG TPA: hypothetical protein VFC56_14710 [Stellaceae bacterium]|nr:hypothetical protein [Stellaceae bacterium]